MTGPKLISDLPVAEGINNDYLIAIGTTAGILYQTTLGDLSINQTNGGASNSYYFTDLRYLKLEGDGETVDQSVTFSGTVSLNNVSSTPKFKNGLNIPNNQSVYFQTSGTLSVYATEGDGSSPSIAFPWKSGTIALTSDIDGFESNLNNNYIPWSALTFTTLVSPTITVAWTATMHDGSSHYTISSPNASNITVDTGAIVSQGSSWSYPIPGTGQSAPSSVSGSYGTAFGGPNTPSTTLSTTVTSTTSYSVILSKPKSGLIVVGNQVATPSGTDTTSAGISVSFRGKGYLFYNTSNTLNATDINNLITTSLGSMNGAFQSSVGRTYTNVTAIAGYYTYIIYEADLGNINTIVMNGATPVLTAFAHQSNLTIINEAQYSIAYAIYVSNITQAFTGATLVIS